MDNRKMIEARLEKKLTQAQLANLISVSRQTINMIENNDYNPTLLLCKKICIALDKTLDELFWDKTLKKGDNNE